MSKPHLRLHYRWSNGLQKFIWFVRFEDDFPTSYYDTSKAAVKAAGEYFS